MSTVREFTKSQRRRLRELSGVAYERDLAAELEKLEASFRRWRAAELDAFELSDLLHRFHEGPSRELFTKYADRNADMMVAYALHRGILTEIEAGPEIVELLRSHLAFFRERDQR
jgi:hypothetical protein